ncbi:HNH endonuclease [Novosphingobium colocasiae]
MAESKPPSRQGLRANHRVSNRMAVHRINPPLHSPHRKAMKNTPDNYESGSDGYVWHHVDDFNAATHSATLELVTIGAHRATYPHMGSVAQYERYFDVKYKR